MPLYVLDKAICICSQSSTPSMIQVRSHSLVRIQSMLQATENDRPVTPFGCCNNNPYKPCTLNLLMWMDTAQDTTILGQKCLLESSYIMCAMGGRITIQSHLQQHLPIEGQGQDTIE